MKIYDLIYDNIIYPIQEYFDLRKQYARIGKRTRRFLSFKEFVENCQDE